MKTMKKRLFGTILLLALRSPSCMLDGTTQIRKRENKRRRQGNDRLATTEQPYTKEGAEKAAKPPVRS